MYDKSVTTVKIQPRVCGDYIEAVESEEIKNDTTPRMRGLLPLR